MRILALARDVELTSNVNGPPFGAVIRSDAKEHTLGPKEYTALWRLCGAQRRRGGFPPTPEELTRVMQQLSSDGLLVEIDVPHAPIGFDHRVSLVDQLELRPVVYEIRDARRLLRFVGVFDAVLLDGCDGRRTASDLCGVVAAYGYEVTAVDVANELGHLQGAGLLESTGLAPRRKSDLTLRPDAIVARAAWTDVEYLIGGEEADVLMRCREPRVVGELVQELGVATDEERAWLVQLLSRAAAIGLVAHVAPQVPRPPKVAAAPIVPAAADDEMMFESPTVVEVEGVDIAPAEDVTPSGAAEIIRRPSTPTPTPMPVTRPTPRPTPVPVQRSTPMPMPVQRSTPMPMPAVMPEATPAPAVDPAMQARLASLAGLSLQKDGIQVSKPAASSSSSSSKLPWILLVVFVIGGGFYHWATVRDPSETTQAAAPSDAGTQASTPSYGQTLLASGYIAAKAPLVLSASTSGRLESVKVDNGDKITKGQVVAVIDGSQIRAELGLAGARVRDAVRSRQRIAALVKAQAATPVDLERATGAVEIASAEAHVIQQRFELTKIKSPIDGTVLEVLAHTGELITLGPNGSAGVLRVADLTALIAEVNVNENELKNVYMGQECEVITDAQRDQNHKGIVKEIAEQADRAKGTVLVKVDIAASTDSVLKPGMAIQVRFKPKPAPTAPPP